MTRKSILLILAALALALPVALAGGLSRGKDALQATSPATGHGPIVIESSRVGSSRPLRELTPLSGDALRSALDSRPFQETFLGRRPAGPGGPAAGAAADPTVQNWFGGPSMPATSVNFEGLASTQNPITLAPPDTNGDVGPNHYVMWVNLIFAVYDKSGALELGPLSGNSIWDGFGGPCELVNHGDPIVLYDHLANRWFISQFALVGGSVGYHQCIAVSKTGDPTGQWSLYDYYYSKVIAQDYPKFGVWPDAYYMTANQFVQNADGDWLNAGVGAVAMERKKMLLGQSARIVFFDLSQVDSAWFGLLPADLDGGPPSLNTPNPFVAAWDDAWGDPDLTLPGGSVDAYLVWDFDVNWTTPSASTFGTFGHPTIIPAAALDTYVCAGYSRTCIPQKGTAQKLDAISERLMWRLQYRNFGAYQTLVSNLTVNAGSGKAGVRWFELRDAGAGWTLNQEGTYAPDSSHRWMGSAAMDINGNIAVGYSLSSSALFPSIAIAGRLAGDPAGTLPQAELIVQAGGGAQTAVERWGDYSSMSVDPVDKCTFWYAQEYCATNQPWGWNTRIAAFKYPTCVKPPAGDVIGKVTDVDTGLPIAAAVVQAQYYETATDANGDYALLEISTGAQNVTAQAYGYLSKTSSVTVLDGVTVTADFALTPSAFGQVQGTVTDGSGHGWPLYAKIYITSPMGFQTTVFTDPTDGTYHVNLAMGFEHDFEVSAVNGGYLPVTRNLTTSADPQTENFSLLVDAVQGCLAAGYAPDNAYFSDFEADNGGFYVENLSPSARTSWAWGKPVSGPNSAHSGAKVWATNLRGNYFLNENSCITTPVIDLHAFAGQNLHVSWWEDLVTEEGYDWADVWVTADGGGNWAHVRESTGVVARQWTPALLVLDPSYATNRFQLSFCIYSNASVAMPGWYIDDVGIGGQSCKTLTGGLLAGQVYDLNTHLGVPDILVEGSGSSTATSSLAAGNGVDGAYSLFLPAGSHVVTAHGQNEYTDTVRTVAIVNNQITMQDFPLAAPWLEAFPDALVFNVSPAALKASRIVAVSNWGGAPGSIQAVEVPSVYVPPLPTGPYAPEGRALGPKNLGKASLAGVRYYLEAPAAPPLAAGSMVQSWLIAAFDVGWGLGYNLKDGNVWVSDYADNNADHEFRPNGIKTGDLIDISSWVGTFAADMAYDPIRNRLYQVNIAADTYGDDCIHELDPATHLSTGTAICPNFGTSQRGLAYDPYGDVFYSGSWNNGVIYKFSRSGTILKSVFTGLAISGLAYNPTTKHLFVLTNSDADADVYVLDAANNLALLGGFAVPGLEAFSQAGMEIDCEGDLWIVDMNDIGTIQDTAVIEVDSGEAYGCKLNVPWLTVAPVEQTIPANTSVGVLFSVNGAKLPLGTYQAHVRLINKGPYEPERRIAIPVTLNVVNNLPPIAAAGNDQYVLRNAAVALSGAGSSDPDGGIATYSWIQTSGAAVILNNPGTATPTFTAPNADAVLAFELTVTDNLGASSQDGVTVTVSLNRAPTANAGGNQTATVGQTVTLNGSGSSDPDGAIVSWEWRQISGPPVTVNNFNAATATFKATKAGVLVFQFIVTDEDGAISIATLTVTVSGGGGKGGGGGGGCGCMVSPDASLSSSLLAAGGYVLPLALALGLRRLARRRK